MSERSILYRTLAAAVIILSAACSKTGEPGVSRVSFTASIGDYTFTRAVADGSGVNHVWCGAYLNGTLITQAEAPVSGGSAILVLDLANNREYDIVMWACNSTKALWNFNPATAQVMATYANETSSSADNDAFWYKGTLVPQGARSIGVELSRAVAQIHIGTTASFSTVSDVEVSVSNVPSTWNLLTGVMGGQADVDFSLGAAPAEDFTIGATNYHFLAAVSVLAPAEKTTTNISFSLDMDGNAVSKSIDNTSICRNWCTRIAGVIQ